MFESIKSSISSAIDSIVSSASEVSEKVEETVSETASNLSEVSLFSEDNQIDKTEDTIEHSQNNVNTTSIATQSTSDTNIKTIKEDFEKTKKEQGAIGNLWDGFKNLTGIGDGSDKVEKAIKQFENGEITEDEAKKALEEYQDGQKVCVDVAGDVVSGIVAVGAFALAVPTGGMSLAAGLAISAGVGAGVKTGMKFTDAKMGDREYTVDNAIYDTVTGGVNGVLAPVTNGLGNTVTKTIATKIGLETAGTTATKSTFKNILLNQSIDVTGGTMKKRAVAIGAGMAVDGSVSGGIYNSTAAAAEGKSADEVLNAGVEGAVGGLIGAPVIGGGFRLAGKLGGKIGDNIFGSNKIKPETPETAKIEQTSGESTIAKNEVNPEQEQMFEFDLQRFPSDSDNLVGDVAGKNAKSSLEVSKQIDPIETEKLQKDLTAFIEKNPIIQNESYLKSSAEELVKNCKSQEQLKLALRVLSDENFCPDKYRMESAIEMVNKCQSEELVQALNKILDSEIVHNDIWIVDAVTKIETMEQCQLMYEILSNEHLLTNKDFVDSLKNIIWAARTPEKIQLTQRIMYDDNLMKNKNLITNASNIISNVQTPNQITFANRILSDEKLMNNVDFLFGTAAQAVFTAKTPEKTELLNKVLSDDDLLKVSTESFRLLKMIGEANTDVQIKLADKILSNKTLLKNKDFVDNSANIIAYVKTPEQIKIAERIISDENLLTNKDFLEHVSNFIYNVNTPEQVKIVNKILDSENLLRNNYFLYEAGTIIYQAKTPQKVEIVNKILSDEKLYNNQNILRLAQSFLKKAESEPQINLLNRILDDKNLLNDKDFLENHFLPFIELTTNYPKLEVVNSILSNEKLLKDKTSLFYARTIIDSVNNPEQVKAANKILFDENLMQNKEFSSRDFAQIISSIKNSEQLKVVDKILSNEDLLLNSYIRNNFRVIIKNAETEEQAKIMSKILDNIDTLSKNTYLMNSLQYKIGNLSTKEARENALKTFEQCTKPLDFSEALYKLHCEENINTIKNHKKTTQNPVEIEFYKSVNIDEIAKRLENYRQNMLKTPDLYLSGEFEDDFQKKSIVNLYFKECYDGLFMSTACFDDRTIDTLLRSRPDNVSEFLRDFGKLGLESFDLISKLQKSVNIEGKQFTEKEKLSFVNLIASYKNNNIDTDIISKMADDGIVDVNKLNVNLFNGILKNCGLTDEEMSKISQEKLLSWDMKYMHLLAGTVSEDKQVFTDFLRAANLDDFNRFIHDTSNVYGQANAKTKEAFKGMNYDKWLKPSVENEVKFKSNDSNLQRLNQISNQLKEDIDVLMQTPAGGFIKKQLPHCVKDGQFTIPADCLTSKAKTTEFIQNILKQLEPVFKRAEGNLENPNKKQMAQSTLTIKDHLNQRLDDLEKTGEIKSTKTLDLTIKMWDRNPQKDIFQGNYSTCCIGMGNVNGHAMPHYLMNTAYNMIELKDNQTGEIIGNALCYFVKNEEGKPAFIIDNIEINNSIKPSDEVGKDLRSAITEYAKNISKEVTGNDNTPIFMSNNYNDVPCNDLPIERKPMNFLGDIDCEEIYMDLYNGWVSKNSFPKTLQLFKLS